MTPLKQYTAAVAGQDLSGQVKDGVLQIGNPAAQFVLQVKVKDAPADSHVQPLYAGQVDYKCDKPEKVLVLEIDSDGSGKFNLVAVERRCGRQLPSIAPGPKVLLSSPLAGLTFPPWAGRASIKRRALEAGFDLMGIAPPAALKDSEFLSQWVKKGFGGEMRYLADPRRADPHRVLPSVKSVISVGLFYNTPTLIPRRLVARARASETRPLLSRQAAKCAREPGFHVMRGAGTITTCCAGSSNNCVRRSRSWSPVSRREFTWTRGPFWSGLTHVFRGSDGWARTPA